MSVTIIIFVLFTWKLSMVLIWSWICGSSSVLADVTLLENESFVLIELIWIELNWWKQGNYSWRGSSACVCVFRCWFKIDLNFGKSWFKSHCSSRNRHLCEVKMSCFVFALLFMVYFRLKCKLVLTLHIFLFMMCNCLSTFICLVDFGCLVSWPQLIKKPWL